MSCLLYLSRIVNNMRSFLTLLGQWHLGLNSLRGLICRVIVAVLQPLKLRIFITEVNKQNSFESNRVNRNVISINIIADLMLEFW